MVLAQLPAGQNEGVERIAKKIKAPPNYLGKLLQQLSSQKIVISQKGLNGGFRLGKDPQKIKLYEIVNSIENISQWSECALGLRQCSSISSCAVHDCWKSVRDIYLGFLKTTSIKDLT